MSRKQEIYATILRLCLPTARNLLSSNLLIGRKRLEAFELCQLSHNLHTSILTAEFTAHDIWFLNVQAKHFYEHCSQITLYKPITKLIQELYSITPEHFKADLEWQGPDA